MSLGASLDKSGGGQGQHNPKHGLATPSDDRKHKGVWSQGGRKEAMHLLQS